MAAPLFCYNQREIRAGLAGKEYSDKMVKKLQIQQQIFFPGQIFSCYNVHESEEHSMKKIKTAGILAFLRNWNEYFYASLLTTREAKRTLPVTLQFFDQALTYDYTKLFAALTVAVIPAIIIYCFAQEQVQQSIASSGVKG